MILINLLPHREAARKRRREMFYAGLGVAAATGFLIAGGIWLWYSAQISGQQNRNQILATEIKRLEAQIKDIATLQEEIAALRARQQAVEDLQANRNMPVHLLNELVRALPGLGEAITAQTSFPCALADPFQGMQFGDNVREKKVRREAPSYLTSCGLAMRRFLQ